MSTALQSNAPATSTFAIIERNKGRIHPLVVSEGAVCTEMLDLYQNEGIITEPAGALSVAALKELKFSPGETVGVHHLGW